MPEYSDRKVDVWTWHNAEVVRETFQFEVRLRVPRNVAQGKVEYYITTTTEPLVQISAATMEDLRAQLDLAIRDFYAITWSPVLLVGIKHGKGEITSKLELSVNEFDVGTGDRTGQRYFRRKTKRYGSDRVEVVAGELHEAWEISHNKDVDFAVLPDTPEHRATLTAMRQSIENLARAMRGDEHIMPARILRVRDLEGLTDEERAQTLETEGRR